MLYLIAVCTSNTPLGYLDPDGPDRPLLLPWFGLSLGDRFSKQVFDNLHVVRDARITEVLIVPELYAAVSSNTRQTAGGGITFE